MFIQEWGASRTRFPIKGEETTSGILQRPYPIDVKATRNVPFYDQECNAFYSDVNAIRAAAFHVMDRINARPLVRMPFFK